MPNRQPSRLNSLFGTRVTKERRPAGVSRRRKKQFGFETLEPRQVMSASGIVTPFNLLPDGGATTGSFSSSTAQGQLDLLARELWWQSQMGSAHDSGGMITNSAPNDPYFQNQWHLFNTGQSVGNPDFQPIYGVAGEDINVMGAWNLGYTGAGVTVAVLDSGTQLNHPDLAANINLGLAFDALSPAGNGNPAFGDPGNAHGTAVAGLIGAIANNGIGGAGVAPGVTLVPIRLIDQGQTEQAFINAFRHTIFNGIDITNNSWGPGVTRGLAGPTASELLALRDSIIYGREGKGVIHVFASGNDGGPQFNEGFQPLGGYDTSAYNGWINSRYTIGVTGVDHDGFYNNIDGTITAYPEISAGVLVAAPTGSNAGPVIANDTGLGSGLWTTDMTGDLGYNVAPDVDGHETQDPFFPFDRDFLQNTDYTSRMNGTSGAAPLVSGVIALMLEANPDLTWRDVQEILVRSARQNAPLDVPSDGQGQGTGFGTQSTWIVNQVPIFHDPDFYYPNIPTSPVLQTLAPVLAPNFGFVNGVAGSFHPDHHVGTPHVMTNGAGYTVSQGIGPNGEMTGYAHGVIDAELAVLLAEQWHTKNQALPAELSFTSFVQGQGWALPAAQKSNEASGFQIIPGGIGGNGPFASWWSEYFDPAPDFGALPPLYRGDSSIELNVPPGQTMSLENVEVKISINAGGDDASVLDHVRILLVSPDGTHSELNHYWIDDPGDPFTNQLDDPNLTRAIPVYGTPGSVDTDPEGNFVWTFRSTRHWGERSNDAIVFDPTTGEPVIDETGIYQTGIVDPITGQPIITPGEAMTQGWRIVIENWDFDTSMVLSGVEIAWHGRPLGADTQRISGAIGVDDNRDDLFNYSRMISVTNDIDGDPTINRLGEVQNIPDVNQESFGANVTVVARRASDNQVVARFVTGNDGNYYFDLVPDDYIISIEDPEGRIAQDDTVTAAGQLRHYKSEWLVTEDYFKVWNKVNGSPTETVVDANGVPEAWLDDNGNEQEYGMKGINFLLDPGDQPADQVSFSGTVYADTNGDGLFNSNDVALPNITVYVDINRNGAFDLGEITALTDAAGNYTVVQTGVAAPATMNVGIVRPTNWNSTNPLTGLHTQFVSPGEVYGNVNFAIRPPAIDNLSGGGIDQPGILMGAVFEDLNANGVREAAEKGSPNVTVYLDANNNGIKEANEASTTTNQFGAYVFTNVAPGQQAVRVEVFSPIGQTSRGGEPWVVDLNGGSTISTLHFGILDAAVNDFGDLPSNPQDPNGAHRYEWRPDGAGGWIYDPARHKKGQYWLGTSVDGELANAPTTDANGDDLVDDDEGGVTFDPIIAGATGRITVNANSYTGYLQGWVDWNDDGDFLDEGERIVTDALLIAGNNSIFFNVPDDVTATQVYARFRFGEHSHGPSGAARAINTPWGQALAGEVEDYRVIVDDPAGPIVVGIPADFDQDQDVDGYDVLAWQRNLGKNTGATKAEGNADGDGDVDAADLDAWKGSFGETGGAAAASSGSSAPASGGSSFASSTVASGAVRSNLKNEFPVYVASLSSPTVSDVPTTTEAADRSVLAKISGRLFEAAGELREAGDRAEARVGIVREAIDSWVADAEDQSFDSLFGWRRRGQRTDLELELAVGSDADEAFAAIADHFEWRRD